MKYITLNKLKILEIGIIEKILNKGSPKNRFLSLGFIPGNKVKSVLIDHSGTLKAYEIKGAIIALRDEDANKILVKKQN